MSDLEQPIPERGGTEQLFFSKIIIKIILSFMVKLRFLIVEYHTLAAMYQNVFS